MKRRQALKSTAAAALTLAAGPALSGANGHRIAKTSLSQLCAVSLGCPGLPIPISNNSTPQRESAVAGRKA